LRNFSRKKARERIRGRVLAWKAILAVAEAGDREDGAARENGA